MTRAAAGGITPPHDNGDHTSARLGIWLFLFTETLFFAGLFLLYSLYRSRFLEDFHFCAGNLDTSAGTAATALLLTSSLTMALAVGHLAKNKRKKAALFLSVTILFGILFLVSRYFEWSLQFKQHLYPESEVLQQHPVGENIFYRLHYLLMGLHGLHVIVGIAALMVILYLVMGKPGQKPGMDDPTAGLMSKLENSGLFWHLVTVIWIFLFPLFYLIT